MRPFGSRCAIALAVRAVLHRDEAELDKASVGFLDLRRRQAERLLLHARRGPYDRPAALLPVLRLREAEQPVERMHQARCDAEMRRRCLEGGEQLAGRRDAFRQSGKTFGRAVGLQQPQCQPPKAGRAACLPGGAPWAQLSCAIVIPLSGWIATGKPPPLTETAISVDRSGVYWLGWGL